jgi:uncharacterized Rmd1/YagE family protein
VPGHHHQEESRFYQPDIKLVQSRRSHRVEWHVVTLVVCEIVLTRCEMFIRGR